MGSYLPLILTSPLQEWVMLPCSWAGCLWENIPNHGIPHHPCPKHMELMLLLLRSKAIFPPSSCTGFNPGMRKACFHRRRCEKGRWPHREIADLWHRGMTMSHIRLGFSWVRMVPTVIYELTKYQMSPEGDKRHWSLSSWWCFKSILCNPWCFR